MSRCRSAALAAVSLFAAASLFHSPTARADDDEDEAPAKKEEKKKDEKPKEDPVEAQRLQQVTPLMKMVIWPGKKKFDPADFPIVFTGDGRVKELDLTNPYVKKLPKRIRGVTKLRALTNLKELEKLTIARISVLDLSPLSALERLSFVRLADIPKLPVLAPLARLGALKTLILEDLRIKDPESLGKLATVEELQLVRVGLRSLDAIAPLVKVKKLYLSGNTGLKDLSVLAKLTELEELHIDGVGAKDLSPLAGLKKLQKVTVSVGTETKPIERIDGIEINRVR